VKKKTIILSSAVIVLAVLAAGYYFVLRPILSPSTPVAVATDALLGWKFPASATKFPSTGSAAGGDLAYSTIRDPGGIPQGLPVFLEIPIIGVDSSIEDALITPDGRMDVPAGTVDVAWFALGPHPGQVGSAVIGGHYGIQNNVPFVFYDLNKLRVGDNIYIVDDENNTIEFVVRSIKSFARDADATTVFTSTDGLAHLNLITCEGVWNEVDGNYPDRLVVFTDLVSSSAAPVVSAKASSTSTASSSVAPFSQSLSVGESGVQVVKLQTFLEQRGLLELPTGVTNGYFGSLTSAAVSAYQTSVGISPVGIFGPMTIAKINADIANNPVLPNTGENLVLPVSTSSSQTLAGIAAPSPSFGQTIISVLQNLYGTFLDGLITSVLIILIIFMLVKIIW